MKCFRASSNSINFTRMRNLFDDTHAGRTLRFSKTICPTVNGSLDRKETAYSVHAAGSYSLSGLSTPQQTKSLHLHSIFYLLGCTWHLHSRISDDFSPCVVWRNNRRPQQTTDLFGKRNMWYMSALHSVLLDRRQAPHRLAAQRAALPSTVTGLANRSYDLLSNHTGMGCYSSTLCTQHQLVLPFLDRLANCPRGAQSQFQ